MKPVPEPDQQAGLSAACGFSIAINPGDVVAGFRIVRELGTGGASRVFLGEDQTGRRWIALKVSRDTSPEAAALQKLDHPGIVAMYSQQKWESHDVLAMQYVPGPSLAECLERSHCNTNASPAIFPQKKRDQRRFACQIALEVAQALEHAHSRGVWHLDVKPENILLTEAGRAVLIDFNAAQFSEAEASGSRKVLGGTLAYMSLEQLAQVSGTRAEAALDFRSDIYSLGVVFYELLTGRQLFPVRDIHQGMVESAREAMADRLHADWLRSQLSELPRIYRPLIAKCLAPLSVPSAEQARYQSTSDLVRDLQDAQSGRLPRHAMPASPAGRFFRSLRMPPRGVAALVAVIFTIVVLAGFRHWRISDGIDQVDQEVQSVMENPDLLRKEFTLAAFDDWETRIRKRSWIETEELKQRRLRTEHHLAMAAIAGGQYQRAVVILEGMLRKHPERGEAWHNLGIARFHLKVYSGAAAAFQSALANGADPAEVLAARAAAYGAMNMFDEALADIERARKINPDSNAVERQWQLLKSLRLLEQ